MVLTTKLYPAEDLWAMTGDEPREIWDGELRTVAGSGDRATRTALAIGASLLAYERDLGIGMATSSVGAFILSTRPDTVVVPVAAIVRWERIPDHHDTATYIPVAPDLAVEDQSPTDEPKEMFTSERSMPTPACRSCGVNPETRTVAIYRSGELAEVLSEGDTLDGGDVLPGLSIAVAEIFPLPRSR